MIKVQCNFINWFLFYLKFLQKILKRILLETKFLLWYKKFFLNLYFSMVSLKYHWFLVKKKKHYIKLQAKKLKLYYSSLDKYVQTSKLNSNILPPIFQACFTMYIWLRHLKMSLAGETNMYTHISSFLRCLKACPSLPKTVLFICGPLPRSQTHGENLQSSV